MGLKTLQNYIAASLRPARKMAAKSKNVNCAPDQSDAVDPLRRMEARAVEAELARDIANSRVTALEAELAALRAMGTPSTAAASTARAG